MTHLAFLFWVNWVWFFGFLGGDKFGFLILMGLTWFFFHLVCFASLFTHCMCLIWLLSGLIFEFSRVKDFSLSN